MVVQQEQQLFAIKKTQFGLIWTILALWALGSVPMNRPSFLGIVEEEQLFLWNYFLISPILNKAL